MFSTSLTAQNVKGQNKVWQYTVFSTVIFISGRVPTWSFWWPSVCRLSVEIWLHSVSSLSVLDGFKWKIPSKVMEHSTVVLLLVMQSFNTTLLSFRYTTSTKKRHPSRTYSWNVWDRSQLGWREDYTCLGQQSVGERNWTKTVACVGYLSRCSSY